MSLDKKKLGEQELKRALLMMKYDSRKTLSENTKYILNESINMWDYVDSRSPDINVNLGVNELQIGNFTGNGWSEVQLSEVTRDVSDDEGLVDAFDRNLGGFLGDNMEDNDMLLANSIIGKYKLSYVNWNGKFYPAMEAVRAKYSEDESGVGDSLRADIWDPPGVNTSDVQKFSKDTAAIYDDSYKKWCDILNNLSVAQDGDDKQDPELPPKNQAESKYRACKGTPEDPFKKGCFEQDTNGPIHKVQTCLGVVSDGKFWVKTETALLTKTSKNSFTKDEVNSICGTVQTSPEAKPQTNAVNVELETGSNEVSDTSAF
jgi:hypothetical protein